MVVIEIEMEFDFRSNKRRKKNTNILKRNSLRFYRKSIRGTLNN